MPEKLTDVASRLRKLVGELGAEVKALMKHEQFLADPSLDVAEMKANIMLAYRHLEDARMRLGKVIQAYDGGTSVYDQ